MIEECVWKEIAIKQREKELKQCGRTDGTMNYEITGCYDCAGKDQNKQCYLRYERNDSGTTG